MTSNYPPGVTGAEPHIDGEPHQTTTDALALLARGRFAEVEPGNRATLSRRGWAWYDPPRSRRMILTPRGRAVLGARREL